MHIDLTLPLVPKMIEDPMGNPSLAGHWGTHFDVMDKEFPLDYTRRKGLVFDVSGVTDRDIEISDIDLSAVEESMFVAFYTGFASKVGYGTPGYFTAHPQLSNELIYALVERGISIIAVDFAGIRRGKEHVPIDQYCADRGVFVIENLFHLDTVLEQGGPFIAHIYPMNFTGMTGLPCRVIAELP